ncbi:MAG: SgcJ/EcaC family oxidoreductase [Mariniblastus sp.]|nr:SgcJ/EcaC family oxidoreductase [Mariniblastus sp.]
MYHYLSFVFAGFMSLGLASSVSSQETKPSKPTTQTQALGEQNRRSIEQVISSYESAFNSKNVETLISHWTATGVYSSQTSGKTTTGRAAMRKQFEILFTDTPSINISLETDSIQFISPNVALEQGRVTVFAKDGQTTQSDYDVVFVKQQNQWLIDRVSDSESEAVNSSYAELKKLEWLIGQWTATAPGHRVEYTCQWTVNQNFISRKFTVFDPSNETIASGLQMIGWDAKAGLIRSWLFDSDGGLIKGTWHSGDNQWTVQSVASFADGGSGSFSGVFQLHENGEHSWKKTNRVIDGQLMPNIESIRSRRK